MLLILNLNINAENILFVVVYNYLQNFCWDTDPNFIVIYKYGILLTEILVKANSIATFCIFQFS